MKFELGKLQREWRKMLTNGELLCVVLTVTHIRHLIPHMQRVYLVGEVRPETIDLLDCKLINQWSVGFYF